MVATVTKHVEKYLLHFADQQHDMRLCISYQPWSLTK